ncbi:MAG: hypothetical protein ACMXX9_00320 [Candidatus Woesearchaeota archaeon]
MYQNNSNLSDSKLIKKIHSNKVRDKELYLSEGINRFVVSEKKEFLHSLLDPFFKNKSTEQINSNMGLLNKLIKLYPDIEQGDLSYFTDTADLLSSTYFNVAADLSLKDYDYVVEMSLNSVNCKKVVRDKFLSLGLGSAAKFYFDDDFVNILDTHLVFDKDLSFNHVKNLVLKADYHKFNLYKKYDSDLFLVGITENMLYSEPVLDLFANNR